MSTWRRKAMEAAPDIRDRLDAAWSPMSAWIELQLYFEKAVKGGDMAAARRVMACARYCLVAPSADVRTAVAVAFIEHLAQEKEVRERLPELISAQEARDWREIMVYHSDDRTVAAVIEACRKRRAEP